jgi:hypothetical protein
MPAQTEGMVLVPRAELEALCQPTPVIKAEGVLAGCRQRPNAAIPYTDA